MRIIVAGLNILTSWDKAPGLVIHYTMYCLFAAVLLLFCSCVGSCMALVLSLMHSSMHTASWVALHVVTLSHFYLSALRAYHICLVTTYNNS